MRNRGRNENEKAHNATSQEPKKSRKVKKNQEKENRQIEREPCRTSRIRFVKPRSRPHGPCEIAQRTDDQFEKEENKSENNHASFKNSNAPTLLVANINMRLTITSSTKIKGKSIVDRNTGKETSAFYAMLTKRVSLVFRCMAFSRS
jgi:lipopolysaccharide export LptBFGC system permease protein LptF